MEEREVRIEVCNGLDKLLQKGIGEVVDRYKGRIEFFTIYPLIMLEENYKKEVPESITSVTKRGVISWYLKSVHTIISNSALCIRFKQRDYEEFCNEVYPVISNIYQDTRTLREMRDHRSVEKSKIECIDHINNKYKMTTALVTDKYKVENFYYHGLDNKLQMEKDQRFIVKQIDDFIEKHAPKKRSDLQKIKRLHIDIDEYFLSRFRERVMIDINKLADSFESKVIESKDSINDFLGLIYYFAHCRKFYNSANQNIEDSIYCIEKEWLINKTCKVLDMQTNIVEKYIEYFTLCEEGSLSEFPFIQTKHNLLFNSSSILLNDWHFTLVNGHFAKKILFKNRDISISSKAVADIAEKANEYENLYVVTEFYYEFVNSIGELDKSDIDIAIYDKINNKVLIVEVKWKDNHYVSESDVNYFKVEKTHYDIFSKQISKHKEFIGTATLDRLKKIFLEHNIEFKEEIPEILYVATDKRYQLHFEDQNMLTSYQLMGLIDMFSDGNVADFVKLFTEINSLRTITKYIFTDNIREIQLGKVKLITDDISGDYS